MTDALEALRAPARWRSLQTAFPQGASGGQSARSMLFVATTALAEKLFVAKTGIDVCLDLLTHRNTGEIILRHGAGEAQKKSLVPVRVGGQSILTIGAGSVSLFLSGPGAALRLVHHLL